MFPRLRKKKFEKNRRSVVPEKFRKPFIFFDFKNGSNNAAQHRNCPVFAVAFCNAGFTQPLGVRKKIYGTPHPGGAFA